MAFVVKHKIPEIRPEDREVVVKLEITLNINTTTGQISVGAEPTSSVPKMQVPEFFIPKFDATTELIEGFGEEK